MCHLVPAAPRPAAPSVTGVVRPTPTVGRPERPQVVHDRSCGRTDDIGGLWTVQDQPTRRVRATPTTTGTTPTRTNAGRKHTASGPTACTPARRARSSACHRVRSRWSAATSRTESASGAPVTVARATARSRAASGSLVSAGDLGPRRKVGTGPDGEGHRPQPHPDRPTDRVGHCDQGVGRSRPGFQAGGRQVRGPREVPVDDGSRGSRLAATTGRRHTEPQRHDDQQQTGSGATGDQQHGSDRRHRPGHPVRQLGSRQQPGPMTSSRTIGRPGSRRSRPEPVQARGAGPPVAGEQPSQPGEQHGGEGSVHRASALATMASVQATPADTSVAPASRQQPTGLGRQQETARVGTEGGPEEHPGARQQGEEEGGRPGSGQLGRDLAPDALVGARGLGEPGCRAGQPGASDLDQPPGRGEVDEQARPVVSRCQRDHQVGGRAAGRRRDRRVPRTGGCGQRHPGSGTAAQLGRQRGEQVDRRSTPACGAPTGCAGRGRPHDGQPGQPGGRGEHHRPSRPGDHNRHDRHRNPPGQICRPGSPTTLTRSSCRDPAQDG